MQMNKRREQGRGTRRYRAMVIGVSAGGLKALSTVLPSLGPELPLPVFLVQHMSPASDSYLVEHFRKICQVKVKFAEDKEMPEQSVIYIAPPDYHLLIEADYSLALSVENRVNYSRPSIDVLFETAAETYLDSLIGVIMTGANADGSKGLLRVKECGGTTVVQSPRTAEAPVMPQSAIDVGGGDHIVALDQLGTFLNMMATGQ